MKKQLSEHTPNNNWWVYITVLLASIICAILIFEYYSERTSMPESVKQEWIREKSREDATREYFTEIRKHLEVNFVDGHTVQIVWKNWEVDRESYPVWDKVVWSDSTYYIGTDTIQFRLHVGGTK